MRDARQAELPLHGQGRRSLADQEHDRLRRELWQALAKKPVPVCRDRIQALSQHLARRGLS